MYAGCVSLRISLWSETSRSYCWSLLLWSVILSPSCSLCAASFLLSPQYSPLSTRILIQLNMEDWPSRLGIFSTLQLASMTMVIWPIANSASLSYKSFSCSSETSFSWTTSLPFYQRLTRTWSKLVFSCTKWTSTSIASASWSLSKSRVTERSCCILLRSRTCQPWWFHSLSVLPQCASYQKAFLTWCTGSKIWSSLVASLSLKQD